MSIDVASGDDLELWHVQLGGTVRTMSLDELDQAFQSGAINERTMVLRAGALHWTTLGNVAGIDDHANSIAPMATDVPSSNVVIPPLPMPSFDVSFGTEELRVFRPKRRVGRALGVVVVLALVAGAVLGVKTYGTEKLQAQLASVTSVLRGKNAESARSAAVVSAPVAEPKAATATPPPTPVESLPSAKPAAPGVSVDSLPSAPPEKAEKKRRKSGEPGSKRRAAPAKAKSKPSTDPSGRFDPLNGSL